jgi:uncharacterized damage-inducible protein DinB
MTVKSVKEFIKYYERTREITKQVIGVIPPDKIDWTYRTGKFTIADLVRHIAAIERNVFMEVVQGHKATYKGCRSELADGYENVINYFDEMHRQSIAILSALNDDDLLNEVKALDGKNTSVGNFLRALIVHEVHHRGALCIYLNLLDVKTPPVIGLMEEEVIEFSK